MKEFSGYDGWKLSAPPTDKGLDEYLQSMTVEEILEVCGDFVIERMKEHYHDMKADTP